MKGVKMEKSVILLQIKVALKLAMMEEVRLRKATVNDIIDNDEYKRAVNHKTVSRAIISMFPELGIKPADATDDDVIKLLKKYISQEKERNVYQLGYLKEKDVEGKSAAEVKKLVNNTVTELGDALSSELIEIAQGYLPAQATEEDIIVWINDNLDLSQFRNKMQAMGPIMKQFKGADGNFVKGILLKL